MLEYLRNTSFDLFPMTHSLSPPCSKKRNVLLVDHHIPSLEISGEFFVFLLTILTIQQGPFLVCLKKWFVYVCGRERGRSGEVMRGKDLQLKDAGVGKETGALNKRKSEIEWCNRVLCPITFIL